jgi:hypothetical protein
MTPSLAQDEHSDQSKAFMAASKLIPGSVVTQSGFYLVSHSNGHMADASTHLMEGSILPNCDHDGCCVLYTLVRTTSDISQADDFKHSQTFTSAPTAPLSPKSGRRSR